MAPSGCWIWKQGTDTHGYPKANVNPGHRTRLVHRVSYEVFVGPIPDGLELDHLCHRILCVRPLHLSPVTTAENSRRSTSMAAMQGRSATCWSCGEAKAPAGRARQRKGSRRFCPACARAARARWAARQAARAAAATLPLG